MCRPWRDWSLLARRSVPFSIFNNVAKIEQRLAALRKDAKTIPIDHKWSWQIKAEEEKRKEQEEMDKWVSDEFIAFEQLHYRRLFRRD